MRRRSVGVIGCAGFMSQAVYLPALTAMREVDVAAACDIRPQLGATVARRFGVPRFSCSAEELLQNPAVDAVFVLTPPWTHAELGRACLDAGKDVFLEKPIALSSVLARRLVALADARQLVLCVGYMKRHDHLCQLAERLATRPRVRLGRTVAALLEVTLGGWRDLRSDQAVLDAAPAPVPDDLGLPGWVDPSDRSLYFSLVSAFCHDLNLLRALAGEPRAVRRSRFHARTSGGGCISATLDFGDFDGVVVLRVARPPARWHERLVLTFEHGQIELEVGAPLLPAATTRLTAQLGARVIERRATSRAALDHQIGSFVRALDTRQVTAGDGRDAVRDVQLGEAIYHTRAAAGQP
jgi:predicted dehydrogenase